MSDKPTIEERMRAVSYSHPDRYEVGVRIVVAETAAQVAREYAEERVRPLREALDELLTVAAMRGDDHLPHPADDPLLWTERMQDAWNDAQLALKAEAEARNGK